MQILAVLYPVLLSVWPLLCVYCICLGNYLPEELITAAFVCMVSILLFQLLMQLLVKDWHKSGLLALLMLITVWSYVPFETGVTAFTGAEGDWIFILYLILCISTIVFVSRSKLSFKACTQPLFVLALFLCIYNVYPIVQSEIQLAAQSARLVSDNTTEDVALKLVAPQQLPDIYYVIVDAFANPTTLKEKYGYDDSAFVDFEEKAILCGLRKRQQL